MALQFAHHTGTVLTCSSETGLVCSRVPSHRRVAMASCLHLGSFKQLKAIPGCWIRQLPSSPYDADLRSPTSPPLGPSQGKTKPSSLVWRDYRVWLLYSFPGSFCCSTPLPQISALADFFCPRHASGSLPIRFCTRHPLSMERSSSMDILSR